MIKSFRAWMLQRQRKAHDLAYRSGMGWSAFEVLVNHRDPEEVLLELDAYTYGQTQTPFDMGAYVMADHLQKTTKDWD